MTQAIDSGTDVVYTAEIVIQHDVSYLSGNDERSCQLVSCLILTCLLEKELSASVHHVATVVLNAVCCEISCVVRARERQSILGGIG